MNIIFITELEKKIQFSIVKNVKQIIKDGMSNVFWEYILEKNPKFIVLPLLNLIYFENFEKNLEIDYFEFYPKNFKYFRGKKYDNY